MLLSVCKSTPDMYPRRRFVTTWPTVGEFDTRLQLDFAL